MMFASFLHSQSQSSTIFKDTFALLDTFVGGLDGGFKKNLLSSSIVVEWSSVAAFLSEKANNMQSMNTESAIGMKFRVS